MIQLIVDASFFKIPNTDTSLDFVRIKCMVGFKKKDSSEYCLAEGIIDTGAYVTVIPKTLADKIEKEVTGEYKMKGLNQRDECAIPVSVGKATCVIFDKSGNSSGNLDISCFFAHTEDCPVIIGFADLLSKFKINIDSSRKTAFLE